MVVVYKFFHAVCDAKLIYMGIYWTRVNVARIFPNSFALLLW